MSESVINFDAEQVDEACQQIQRELEVMESSIKSLISVTTDQHETSGLPWVQAGAKMVEKMKSDTDKLISIAADLRKAAQAYADDVHHEATDTTGLHDE